jgi:hypothetical protein
MNINESTLREYVNNVVKSILEDVFDSAESASASRANVKKATNVLGAKSPHTKELAKLHTKMKNSRFVYGVSDSELERKYDTDTRRGKPTLTPMKGKASDGYDAIGGTGDRSVNTGIIKKVAAAIKKNRQDSFNKPKPTQPALVANPTVNKPKPNPALTRNRKIIPMNALRGR